MISVILLMAGVGSRMGIDKNKVLLPLGDKLIFEHSLDLFLSYGFEVVCVINKNDEEFIKNRLQGKAKYIYGGKTRQDSVYNGLNSISGDYVLIHDAARPLISKDVIDNILKIKSDKKGILCYLDTKDTIKINDTKLITLDRSKLISAVTPQCGPKDVLLESYTKAKNENKSFTDDISILEYYSDIKIDLVKANEEVIKVTTKLDYEIVKLLEAKWLELVIHGTLIN